MNPRKLVKFAVMVQAEVWAFDESEARAKAKHALGALDDALSVQDEDLDLPDDAITNPSVVRSVEGVES